MHPPRLLLASQSPRRARLLHEAGYVFDQCDPPFEDPPAPSNHHGQTPQELAIELAARKALSVTDRDAVILAADTLCVGPAGQVLGTPTTRAEARTMIASFVDAAHDVVTGVALSSAGCAAGTTMQFADTARVVFGPVSDDQIERYLDSDDWADKAGGYNLFDRQRDGWPIRVEGDPTTVVGLPMGRLTATLAALGIVPVQKGAASP